MKTLNEIKQELFEAKKKYKKSHFGKLASNYRSASEFEDDLLDNVNGWTIVDNSNGGVPSFYILPGKTSNHGFDSTRSSESYIEVSLTRDGQPYIKQVSAYNKSANVFKLLYDLVGKDMVKRGRVLPAGEFYYPGYKVVGGPHKIKKINGKPLKIQPSKYRSNSNNLWINTDIVFTHTYGDEVEAGLIELPKGMGVRQDENNFVDAGKPILLTNTTLNKIINFLLEEGSQSNNDAESKYWKDWAARGGHHQGGIGGQA